MKLYQGQEILYFDGVTEKLASGEILTLGETRYVLVEFMPGVPYNEIFLAVRSLIMSGYFPVLAHIERYQCLRKSEAIDELIHAGAYMPVSYTHLIIAGSSYPMSFSSFPGRGSLKGQRAIRRWIESGKGIRNFAQADIRHFYSHIQYKIVRKKLERRVKDSFFLHLIDVCMTYFPKEMPLGFYLSQWLANFMLQELDYDIKCKLKIAHHVRYMDNYTLADDNKKKLHQALLYIRQALGKMRLRMKNDWQVFRFEYTKKNGKKTGRCVSAMGWLFYRSKVLIRKHILLHVERIARKLHKKEENGQRFPLGLCRGFVSLLGLSLIHI